MAKHHWLYHPFIHPFIFSAYPCTDFHNKRYSMGSPFYSAPDDIEMTELLGEQGQAPPTPSLNMDHTPQRAPMLVPIMEEEE